MIGNMVKLLLGLLSVGALGAGSCIGSTGCHVESKATIKAFEMTLKIDEPEWSVEADVAAPEGWTMPSDSADGG